MINLKPEELSEVRAILAQYLPETKTMIFGSRTTNKIKKYSDLDLCIFLPKPIPLEFKAELSEAFSESNLPYRVDLVYYYETDEEFRKNILANGLEI